MRYHVKHPKQKKMDEYMARVFNAEYKDENQKAKAKSKKVLHELTEMGVFRK